LAPASALRVALDGAASLRLLLLAACSTGQAVEPSPLASLGAQLLQTGLPAVIAMQYDVRADAAGNFSEQFYRQLVAGRCAGQVDVAVNYGRSALYVHDPDAFAYGTPVLWLNAADGQIFAAERPFVVRAVAPAPGGTAKPSVSDEEIARAEAELAGVEAWLAAAPQFERAAMPSALRSIEGRRQEHLQAVRDLLTLIAAESDPPARARSFGQRKAAIQTQRDHADRLAAFLLANTRGRAGS
jgi:hypothetical protein